MSTSSLKDMFLYHSSLSKPCIQLAIYGNFTKPKSQELLVVRGVWLELLVPDDSTGKLHTLLSTNAFANIRNIMPFRLVGEQRDYVVIGSDSGRISILQYSFDTHSFVVVHEETFGRSGVRRQVPGQLIAVDPKGRALIISAFEKQKFVYILNRDAATNLTISSPLEAHKSNIVIYSIAALDVAFENPMFACLEVDLSDSSYTPAETSSNVVHKYLTFYELDLGLNHVTRKISERVDDTASLLIAVPGGESGPGGVVICAENRVYYRGVNGQYKACTLPRRFGLDTTEKGCIIETHTIHVQKGLFFILLQSEYGDIYKLSFVYEEDNVDEFTLKYFDTIPVSSALAVLKTGFLFSASQSSNSYLYQFQGIGEDDDVSAQSSSKSPDDVAMFKPRQLTNLVLVDELEQAAPIIDMKVADLAKEFTPQIYTLCGKGPRSSLRVLRHGLAVSELAVSELPGNPTAVWALKKAHGDLFYSYIVVSFSNATIVLSIGETVVEVKDSGILEATQTLHVVLLQDSSILQVHPNGLRHIKPDKRINEWKTPGKKTITCVTANERQVCIALSGGEIVYFEMDKNMNLIDLHRKEMGNDVSSLSIAPIADGRQRALFLAIGLFNNTVRIMSLDPSQPLNQLAMQALPAQPSALTITSITGLPVTNLYLYIGLQNGVMIRSVIDESSGQLGDTRKRFLGTRPVKLHVVQLRNRNAVVALSSRCWLSYTHQNSFFLTPLSYDSLEYISSFSSEQCAEGMVCVTANTLRIIMIDKLGEIFNQTIMPLRNTPRKSAIHPLTNQLIILETDNNAYPDKQKKELERALEEEDMKDDIKPEDGEIADKPDSPPESQIGAPHAGAGVWASSIRVVDTIKLETQSLVDLEENEAAFSLCITQFSPQDPMNPVGSPHDWYLLVGTVKDFKPAPKSFTTGYIHCYRLTGQGLVFMHKTPVNDIPLALASFQKKLLVGVGKYLRLYELGKKKLLRKCENKNFPTSIQSITVSHDRIYVGDLCESFHYVTYKKASNEFEIFADQTTPRYLTAQCVLDYDTMCGGDKFGNIFIARLPPEVSNDISKDQTLATLMNKYGKVLQGAANKLVDIANFYVGETITSLTKVALIPGSSEVILYCTLQGTIGFLLPFTSREDVEFFTHLEMHMRVENSSLCGRDHLTFRSYYAPVKNIVDGDLCEVFNAMDNKKQMSIAEELVCTPQEVAKRLEEFRNRVL